MQDTDHKIVPLKLVVAIALIDLDNRVLISKRPIHKHMAGYWEFPGGKVEKGETPEGALIREVEEELAIRIDKSCLSPLTFASHKYESFHLLMPLFVCSVWNGSPKPVEGQVLKWVNIRELRNFDMLPADSPLKAFLRDFL